MAKQGLSKRWKLKDQNWSHLGEEETVERERGESKRGRREEEEGEPSQKRYGCLDFGLELYGFVWISCLDICLWVVGCRKPNPRMNLCMEIPLFL